MEIESLSCNNCGAPLAVPSSAHFVTCVYCGSGLVVRRTASAHYTELLGRLEQYTQQLEGQAEYMRLRDELDVLDAEWQRERKRHLIHRRNGSLQPPTRAYLGTSIVVAVVACALTIVWFYASANAGPAASFFGWIWAIGAVAALANVARVRNKVSNYDMAKQEYQQQRGELLNRLRQVYPEGQEQLQP